MEQSWVSLAPAVSAVSHPREKAERLARLAVSDPILYAIERRKEANEINGTPVSKCLLLHILFFFIMYR